ncbi:hypothetical protein J3Q64DRAFT_1775459 [Phycomyces blakesleeanus]|uniref:Uncharacterized protein n=1 Tax=Phycomyces blakesleeanus TaxID=4837 RepID=A0ABR3AMH2_PHYBL
MLFFLSVQPQWILHLIFHLPTFVHSIFRKCQPLKKFKQTQRNIFLLLFFWLFICPHKICFVLCVYLAIKTNKQTNKQTFHTYLFIYNSHAPIYFLFYFSVPPPPPLLLFFLIF